MKQALSVTRVLSMKKEKLPFEGRWADAFRQPEKTGVWFIWGNSGNGKSSFVMQLCKELSKYGNVLYDSLEEGVCLTMQDTLRRFNMQEVKKKFSLLDCESITDLSTRLSKRKSADFVIIDSIQHSRLNYVKYLALKNKHPKKLLVFISQSEGRKPLGRSAVNIMYDATLKIWIEGYRAFSKGRFIGDTGKFDIWKKGIENYWGSQE